MQREHTQAVLLPQLVWFAPTERTLLFLVRQSVLPQILAVMLPFRGALFLPHAAVELFNQAVVKPHVYLVH